MTKRKRIGGKLYDRQEWAPTRKMAVNIARRYRKLGYSNARAVKEPSGDGYHVYTRE